MNSTSQSPQTGQTPEQKKADSRRTLIIAIVIAAILILTPVIFAVATFVNQATSDPAADQYPASPILNDAYYSSAVSGYGFSVTQTDEFPVMCITFRTKEYYNLTLYGRSDAHCMEVAPVINNLGLHKDD